MATTLDSGYGGTDPVSLIPFGNGLTAGQIAAQGVNAPGTLQALQGYSVPGESYTPGGLVVTPPNLQPGYGARTPTQQAISDFGQGASALGTGARNAQQTAQQAAQAAANAANAAKNALNWGPYVLIGILTIGAIVAAEAL